MIFPGLTIMIGILGFNLLGDALRDILDPRTRRSAGMSPLLSVTRPARRLRPRSASQ